MKTLMRNGSINLDFSIDYFYIFVIGRSNSGHRRCCVTELQILHLLRCKTVTPRWMQDTFLCYGEKAEEGNIAISMTP